MKIGYWIIQENEKTYKGYFNNNGQKEGIWSTYDNKDSTLINESEYISIFEETYILKSSNFKGDSVIVTIDKPPFVKFYYRNITLFVIILSVSVFLRIPINMTLMWTEERKVPYIWIPLITSFQKASNYFIPVLYMFWWSNLKPESKYLGWFSNLLSVLLIGGFCTIIIGLTISGEI